MLTLSQYPKVFSKYVPPILILYVGHLTNSIPMNNMEEYIHITHTRSRLKYALLGFTIHAGLHFFMRTCLHGEWYMYDGIKSPKLRQINIKSFSSGRINCIIYVLIDVSTDD